MSTIDLEIEFERVSMLDTKPAAEFTAEDLAELDAVIAEYFRDMPLTPAFVAQPDVIEVSLVASG
jgi:hypothetical protein